MSPAQNQFPQPKRSASSASNLPDHQATPAAPPAEDSLELHSDPHLDSPRPMISPASSTSAEVTPLNAPDPVSTSSAEDSADSPIDITRQQPIPPASEPMQYRAIGLIQGKYQASDEQFTRGMLVTPDGTRIDAVLLGRVMSLVKKHLDLEQSHLWVVYPRTRDKNNDLHMQIVGVWEPEKLAQGESVDESVEESTQDSASAIANSPNHEDGYFSIRGEVLFYVPEDQRMVVKIQQLPRPGSEQGKMFKLNLNGVLPGNKSVGYFWDLQVQREDNLLVVQEGGVIGLVPPKKRKEGEKSSVRRPNQGSFRKPPQRPSRGGDASRPVTAPAARREPIEKPVKRPKSAE